MGGSLSQQFLGTQLGLARDGGGQHPCPIGKMQNKPSELVEEMTVMETTCCGN